MKLLLPFLYNTMHKYHMLNRDKTLDLQSIICIQKYQNLKNFLDN